MNYFSLLYCFDKKKYKQKLLQALSNQNERRRIDYNELEKSIRENSYLYAKYFVYIIDLHPCYSKEIDMNLPNRLHEEIHV